MDLYIVQYLDQGIWVNHNALPFSDRKSAINSLNAHKNQHSDRQYRIAVYEFIGRLYVC